VWQCTKHRNFKVKINIGSKDQNFKPRPNDTRLLVSTQ